MLLRLHEMMMRRRRKTRKRMAKRGGDERRRKRGGGGGVGPFRGGEFGTLHGWRDSRLLHRPHARREWWKQIQCC